ncbi:MAG: DUF1904 family protein [Bacillota bacterium]
MPNIRISGVSKETVSTLSNLLTNELASVMNLPQTALTFFAGDENLYRGSEKLDNFCYITVEWFDKGEEIQEKVAGILTKATLGNSQLGLERIQTVKMNFIMLVAKNYYANGVHY